MTGKVPIVGGPLDGEEVTPGREKYIVLERRIVKRQATGLEDTDGPLYELLEGRYVHAADRVGLCAGCGAIVRKVEGGSESIACPLCGAEPTRAA